MAAAFLCVSLVIITNVTSFKNFLTSYVGQIFSLTSLYLLCHVVDQQLHNYVCFFLYNYNHTIKDKIDKEEMTNTKNILVEECGGKKPLE